MDANEFRELLRVVHCFGDRPDIAHLDLTGEFTLRVPDGDTRKFLLHFHKAHGDPLSYLDIQQVRVNTPIITETTNSLLDFLDNKHSDV